MKDFSVLDVGCGGGRFTVKPRGDVNCDIDSPTIKILNFVRCDARQLPFRNGLFKKVLLFSILEHIRDYDKALDEALRVSNLQVIVRTDGFLTWRTWSTHDHEYLMMGNKYITYPHILKLFLRDTFLVYPSRYFKGRLQKYANAFLWHAFSLLETVVYGGREKERAWHYYRINVTSATPLKASSL